MSTDSKSRFARRFAFGATLAVAAGAIAFALADKGPRFRARAEMRATSNGDQLPTRVLRRDIVARTLSNKTVAEFDSVRGDPDPVSTVANSLRAVQLDPNRLEVFLSRSDTRDLTLILEAHLKYVADAHRTETCEPLEKDLHRLERQAESLKFEIESAERQILVIPEAPRELAQQLAALQLRKAEREVFMEATNKRIATASAARDTLSKEPATAARDERLKALEAEIENEAARRDSLKAEVRALGKLIDAGVQRGINVARPKADLAPQRELLQKVDETVARLRDEVAAQAVDVGPVFAERFPVPGRVWVLVGAVALAGFACGFFALRREGTEFTSVSR